MKAVILAGREAARLRPLTLNTPKAMVPVLNIPLLEHVIRHLTRHQVKDIILTQGNLGQDIEDYFGDGSQLGLKLSYTIEDTPLGTAGAVKNAARYLDETFLVLNGDIFTDLNLKEMISFHRERRAKVTIALTPVADPTSYGLIETTHQGKVTRFLEKPSPNEVTTKMINAGTYILEPDILEYIPPQTNFSFERQLFPQLLDCGEPIYAYPSSGYWIDIGSPEKYLKLHRDLLSGRSNQYTPTPGEEATVGEGSFIHPTAQIRGPVLVGNNCTIGSKAKLVGPVVIGSGGTISEEVVIEDSLIWHRVYIGPKARVKGSIIANNCHLDDNCRVTDGSVLGDNVTIAKSYRLKPGSQIWPGEKAG